MKRVFIALAVLLVVAASYLCIWGFLPLIPVINGSMEPVIQSGSLLITSPLSAKDIKLSEIIIFKTPAYFRDKYDYPPIGISRVIEINGTFAGLQFQTSGDTAGNDPFAVKSNDIVGSIQYQIPYMGFPLVFLYSKAGTAFIIVVILLLVLYLFSNKIKDIPGRKFHEFITPVIEENHRVNSTLTVRVESTEKALESFAVAMQEYARHMASHTSAIQGLSEASQALKNSAAEQNRILHRFSHTLEIDREERDVSQVKKVVDEIEKRTLMALQIKDLLEGKKPEAGEVTLEFVKPFKETPIPEAAAPLEKTLPSEKIPPPPGCTVKPRVIYVKGHYVSRSAALKQSNN